MKLERLGDREPGLCRGPVSRVPAEHRAADDLQAAARRTATRDGVIRVDDGVAEGGEVSMFYDPMIAKLITWAPTREAASTRRSRRSTRSRSTGFRTISISCRRCCSTRASAPAADHRLHRRGISRRLQGAPADEESAARPRRDRGAGRADPRDPRGADRRAIGRAGIPRECRSSASASATSCRGRSL